MDKQKKKRLWRIIIATATALGVVILLNIYLTKRLEGLLKHELIERTTLATDGFYTLSFDSLSISFFKGELRLEGIKLKPDSAIFNQWKAKDSLPETYVQTEIDVIDFKGVNLVWRWNYRHLHFNTFEIKSPQVQIIDSDYSERIDNAPSSVKAKTLYELVSPYINVVSVKRMNLENATVSYEAKTDNSPILYALDDVSFHAYGFRLDSLSSKSGKLLYCDDFDFVTNQAQTLLTNNDFLLKSDSIRLSTEDSIIYIGRINLILQEELWKERSQRPRNSLDGQIETVEVNGVAFKRENALNFLKARTFSIRSSNVHAVNLEGEKRGQNQSAKSGSTSVNADSLIQALSLYEIISPVLHSVAIDQIGIEKTKLKYTVAVNDSLEVYTLNNFELRAKGFQIDSLSEVGTDLKYFQSVAFEAVGINAMMTSKNQRFDVKRMALDTEKGHFYLEGVHADPLSTKNRTNSISGTVDTISLDGINYSKGLIAGQINLHGLDVDYYKSTDTCISLRIPQAMTKGLNYQLNTNEGTANMTSFHLLSPDIRVIKTSKPTMDYHIRLKYLNFEDASWDKDGFDLGLAEINVDYLSLTKDTFRYEQVKDTTYLAVKGFHINSDWKTYRLDDIRFLTHNLSIPIDNGFFSLNIGSLSIDKKKLILDRFHLESPYSMMEFAYRHPRNDDWFDVKVGHLELIDIDIPAYFSNNMIRMKQAVVNDVELLNFRNQKEPPPRRIVPMIYEGIQKAPVKIDIPQLDVNNFMVTYYELAKKGDEPGKLYITDMNGRFTGFTNVVTAPEQFIRLDAEGKFMGKGDFEATWMLPVDSMHDQFLLHAHLKEFDLRGLNELIVPLAGAEVESGWTHDFIFDMDASSKGGTIQMQFPYQNLKANLLKKKEDELEKNSFTSFLVNTVVRNNNPPHPDKADSELRESHITIVRDPYHSTFNYFWQMLRPALMESVGVSEGTQKFGKGVMKIISGIKGIFHKKDKAAEPGVHTPPESE